MHMGCHPTALLTMHHACTHAWMGAFVHACQQAHLQDGADTRQLLGPLVERPLADGAVQAAHVRHLHHHRQAHLAVACTHTARSAHSPKEGRQNVMARPDPSSNA